MPHRSVDHISLTASLLTEALPPFLAHIPSQPSFMLSQVERHSPGERRLFRPIEGMGMVGGGACDLPVRTNARLPYYGV
jgi:hypothetical protein